jgi:cytochrome P450
MHIIVWRIELTRASGCIRQALIVAMVAPSIVIAAICKHLAEHKDLQKLLREDPSNIPTAIEEFVRMYTPYRGFARTAVCPVTMSGQLIPEKEPITITYAAANRDPSHFENPDQFIMNRENINSHLGFGRGRHRCAGMTLARMMLKVVIQTLLKNTTDFELDGEPEYARLPEIGMIGCPMKFYSSPR